MTPLQQILTYFMKLAVKSKNVYLNGLIETWENALDESIV